jgi:hypothetical protein
LIPHKGRENRRRRIAEILERIRGVLANAEGFDAELARGERTTGG